MLRLKNKSVNIYDAGHTSNCAIGQGYSCEINYAGDRIFVSDSKVDSNNISANASVNVLDYTGTGGSNGWHYHSNIGYNTSSLGHSSQNFGYNIRCNEAGTTVIIGDRAKASRYTVSGTTWSGSSISSLGISSSYDWNFNCSPDLDLFITYQGYCWLWNGSSYDYESSHFTTRDPFESARVCVDNALTKFICCDDNGTSTDIDYVDGIHWRSYSVTPATKATSLQEIIHADFDEPFDRIASTPRNTRMRYDCTDDINTMVFVDNCFSSTAYWGDRWSHTIRVLRRTAGGSWRSMSIIGTGNSLERHSREKSILWDDPDEIPIFTPTTQQIGSGGTFVPAEMNEEGRCLVRWPASGTATTEVEFTIKLNGAILSNADTLDLRVVEYHEQYEEDTHLTTYTNIPTLTATSTASPEQTWIESFRGRNDDGTETTATWIEAAGKSFTPTGDEPFRLRYLIDEVGETGAKDYKLQYVYDEEDADADNVTYKRVRDISGVNRSTTGTLLPDLRRKIFGNSGYDDTITNQGAVELWEWDDTTRDYAFVSRCTTVDTGYHYLGSRVDSSSDGKWTIAFANGATTPNTSFGKLYYARVEANDTMTLHGGWSDRSDQAWIKSVSIADVPPYRSVACTDDGGVYTFEAPTIDGITTGGTNLQPVNTFSTIEVSDVYNKAAISGNGRVLIAVNSLYQRIGTFDWSQDAKIWKERNPDTEATKEFNHYDKTHLGHTYSTLSSSYRPYTNFFGTELIMSDNIAEFTMSSRYDKYNSQFKKGMVFFTWDDTSQLWKYKFI